MKTAFSLLWTLVVRYTQITTFVLLVGVGYVRLLDDETIGSYQVDTSVGEALYTQYSCQTCHGEAGWNPPVEDYPFLAGQPASYLTNQMLDIKYKRRSNGMTTVMWPTVNQVSDEEIRQIALYLSRVEI
jgi:cytochrome c